MLMMLFMMLMTIMMMMRLMMMMMMMMMMQDDHDDDNKITQVHLVAAVKSAELSSDVLRVANVPEVRLQGGQ